MYLLAIVTFFRCEWREKVRLIGCGGKQEVSRYFRTAHKSKGKNPLRLASVAEPFGPTTKLWRMWRQFVIDLSCHGLIYCTPYALRYRVNRKFSVLVVISPVSI